MTRTLEELYTEIYMNGIKSLNELKEDSDLYSEFEEAVYNFLCSTDVAKGIYKSSAAYYDKLGSSDIDSTVPMDVVNEKTGRMEHFNKKVDLKHGDLIHTYYIYLFTETKKKGKSKGNDFFTIIFNTPELEAWLPITVKSFSNWIMDRKNSEKADDSLDRPLTDDSTDTSYALGSMAYTGMNNETSIGNRRKRGAVTGEKTPESTYISTMASTNMITSLADNFLLSHPEYFVSLNWYLCNSEGKYKPTRLYRFFEKKLMLQPSSSEVAQKTVKGVLKDLRRFGLNPDSIPLNNINYTRIVKLLVEIKAISTEKNDFSPEPAKMVALKEREEKVIAELSRWYDRCKHNFRQNKTVLTYK